jgi:hypothetical protein
MPISYFPSPRPDEALYSIFARYHDALGYSSYSHTLLDLYGRSHLSVSLDFATHLDLLLKRISWTGLTQDQLISKHTSLPYYGFLLEPEVVQSAVVAGRVDQQANVDALVGLRTTRVLLPELFRCCRGCVEDDRKKFGSAYWHRVHQLPGVIVCPTHGLTLEHTLLYRHRRKSRYQLVSLEQILQSAEPFSETPRGRHQGRIFQEIAADAQRLITSEPIYETTLVKQLLSSRLRMIGWATRTGRLRCKPIQTAWQERYPSKFREELQCGISTLVDPIPILRRTLSLKYRRPHPLLICMLLRVVGISVDELRQQLARQCQTDRPSENFITFCQNNICPAYNTNQHVNTKPSDKDANCIEVSCGCCGSINIAKLDSPKYLKVLDRGYLWDERLTELVNASNKSLRAIARTLGVDPMTVKRRAAILGIETQWLQPNIPMTSIQTECIDKVEGKRNEWKKLRASNPETSITELRKLKPSLWTWLYRHDRKWLDNNKPAPTLRSSKGRFKDWAVEDRQLILRLETCLVEIKNSPEKPVQITKAELSRRLDITDLFRSTVLSNLPKFDARSAQILETREAFAKRRILWAVKKLREDGIEPQYWQVVRKAGLRPDLEEAWADEIRRQIRND